MTEPREPTQMPIRHELLEGLIRYRENHIETGGFLRAVLENNLKEAVQRGDIDSQRSLCAIVAWCYTQLPANAWGSPEKVRDWLTQKEDKVL